MVWSKVSSQVYGEWSVPACVFARCARISAFPAPLVGSEPSPADPLSTSINTRWGSVRDIRGAHVLYAVIQKTSDQFMDNLLPQVQEIFRAVFDQPDLVITRESDASNVAGWDSLMHVTLIAALMQKFGIRFALGELEDLKNVGDLLDLTQAKLRAKLTSSGFTAAPPVR
jgi:acyl carrier protein